MSPMHVLPIPLGENGPVVLFDLTSKVFIMSNDHDLHECFVNLLLSNVADNNPVDLKYINTQQNI